MSTITFGNRLLKCWDDKSAGLSNEVNISNLQEEEVYFDSLFPISRQDIFVEFYLSLFSWKNETRYYSSVQDICMHPAYQRIIGLGHDALPLIFKELEREVDHWFWALTAITGINPVSHIDWGDMTNMRASWLD